MKSPAPMTPIYSQRLIKDIDPAARNSIEQSYGKLPLSFEVNNGQMDSRVKFISRGNGYTLFLTSTEAVLSLNRGLKKEHQPPTLDRARIDEYQSLSPAKVIRLKSIGANSNPRITGLDELPGKSNYFIGKDPSTWRRNVSNYSKIQVEGIYPGIDVIYYGNQRQLEYDWIVAPGADPKNIQFEVLGATDLQIDAHGNLVLDKNNKLSLNKPTVYQQHADTRTEITARYALLGKGKVGFQMNDYDASLPLVIDPILSYSTYLGGSDEDGVRAIAVDASGCAYVMGETYSTDFPMENALQATPGNEYSNTFVAKLNSSGNALVYSTYLGGSDSDSGLAIAVDDSGYVYIAGRANSMDFPTQNPFQAINAGNGDVFITKLNALGSALVYSTYLGGSNSEYGVGIALDSSGNAYVTGYTNSTNFPTVSAFQSSNGGSYDAFVAKINASGSALAYSTYLGGSGFDEGWGIAVDSSGNAYVTGEMDSTDFPTASPLQANNAGEDDIFITKLNISGSALVYSTYLGGSGSDEGRKIAVDSAGNAYVTGYTTSTDFPTVNPFQSSFGGVYSDGFVVKLNALGSTLVYSTYLGGSSSENVRGIVVDGSGSAYLVGTTYSTDFPTANPFQSAFGGGYSDGFVVKLNAPGSALIFSTYLGGTESDSASGIALDASRNIYITGATASTDFPTKNPFQENNGGGTDSFIAKISLKVAFNDFNADGKPDILWRNISNGANYAWHLDGVTVLAGGSLPTVADQDWNIVGVEDFNNDAKLDILWRNVSNGANYVWYLDEVTVLGGGNLPTVADQDWNIVGVEDFNNDGKPDILWRNVSNGANYVWYLDGVTVQGGGNLPTVADQQWNIVGVEDFNTDGKPDILWRNVSNGANYVWYLDGVTVQGGGSLPTVADQNWKVVGADDFNNDGKPDILWRNVSNGANYFWYLDGVMVLGGGSLPTVADQDWTIVP